MGMSIDADLSALKKKKISNDDDDGMPAKQPAMIQMMPPLQDGAKSSVDQWILPTGYLDEAGRLHREVHLRELTGEEEDILTSRNMPIHVRLGKILENCVVSIGEYDGNNPRWRSIIKDLVSTDRLFLILKLRILSLGPIYSAKMVCRKCEAVSAQSVDLNDFKISGLKDPMTRVWSGTLPSGMTYVAKSQTGWEDAKLAKFSDESKDMMSLSMLGRLVELNGNTKIELKDLKKLGWPDRHSLRKDFSSREGDVDNSIEYECSQCGHQNKEPVDIGSTNFFFPSEASKS